MALLFWEGFDSYADTANLAAAKPIINSGWNTRFGWPAVTQTTGGRFNKGTIRNDGSGWGFGLINFGGGLAVKPTEIYTGRAIKINSAFSSTCLSVYGSSLDSGTGDVWVRYVEGFFQVFNRQGTVLGYSNISYGPYVWRFIELRVKMSSSTTTADGIVELWVDNNKVMSNTACITKAVAGSTGYSGTNLQCYEPGDLTDDIYILDTTGSAPWNTRLGDVRIASVPVIADAIPNDGWVSTGNTNHWTVVDEIPYSAADWLALSSVSSGAGEMFKKDILPSTNVANIYAAAVSVVGGKTDAGNAAFKISIKSGSSTYNSNTQFLSTTNTYYTQEWAANPATGLEWTTDAWANANVGFYIV